MNQPKIVFEDTHILVLEKPAGLATQPDNSGEVNLHEWAQEHFGRNYVGLVHRLDRNTSGLMVIAKRSKAARRLTETIQKKKLKRIYLAWVEGEPPAEMAWTHYLTKNTKNNRMTVHKHEGKGSKIAKLIAETVETRHNKDYPISLVKIQLETGRSHQIRAQFSAEGYPVLGDKKYGSKYEADRLALHSHFIEFPHPMSDEVMRFESEFEFP